MSKMKLPIGYDDFREIREKNKYFIDKSLMIQDFLQYEDKVALITRPRRFGKSLNMTMLRDFFDINQDSKDIFEGLLIERTSCIGVMNTKPVIYITFKDCNGTNKEELAFSLCEALIHEYQKYYKLARNSEINFSDFEYFETLYKKIVNRQASLLELSSSIALLEQVVYELYQKPVVLLIDEYDTPVMSSHQYGYHEEVAAFIANFYGSALKGQRCLECALLTGIQRVVKESIFSKLNNVKVYTMLDERYAAFFGLTEDETKELLSYYEMEFNDAVKQMYDGYRIGQFEMYNPWSILYYCEKQELQPYWINTSSNSMIREYLKRNIPSFHRDFSTLIEKGTVGIELNLETAYAESSSSAALWGLFCNAGYIAVAKRIVSDLYEVRIPNLEVKAEFQNIVSGYVGTEKSYFMKMMQALLSENYEEFSRNYKAIILDCTSYYDSIQHENQFENPYHMLTLGMMISLDSMYQIKSNYELGDGRADIQMISKEPEERAHIIIEFKCDENVKSGAQEALKQIFDKRYMDGLRMEDACGKILCLGIAHYKKKCSIQMKVVD